MSNLYIIKWNISEPKYADFHHFPDEKISLQFFDDGRNSDICSWTTFWREGW